MPDLDALLEQLGGWTVYLATGTVREVRAGRVVVQLDGGRGVVIADPYPTLAALLRADAHGPLRAGAHVLVEQVSADRHLAHGTLPLDVVIPAEGEA